MQLDELEYVTMTLLSRRIPLTVQTVIPFELDMIICPFLKELRWVPRTLLMKNIALQFAVLACIRELFYASFPLASILDLHWPATCPHRLNRQLTLCLLILTLLVGMLAHLLTR